MVVNVAVNGAGGHSQRRVCRIADAGICVWPRHKTEIGRDRDSTPSWLLRGPLRVMDRYRSMAWRSAEFLPPATPNDAGLNAEDLWPRRRPSDERRPETPRNHSVLAIWSDRLGAGRLVERLRWLRHDVRGRWQHTEGTRSSSLGLLQRTRATEKHCGDQSQLRREA